MVHENKTIGNLKESDLELFKSLFDYEEVRSSSFTDVKKQISIDCNYIRVYSFRYWDEQEIYKLNEKTTEFNSNSIYSDIQITSYEDYEMEYDRDRSYPASFTFSIISK